MSYRNDTDALQQQLAQLESRLAEARRDRARLEAQVRHEPELVAELDRVRRTLHARAPRSLPLLDDVRVASPCHERWDAMTGDEQVRFCGGCRKNVYDLSAMTREAAQTLIASREGSLCVRFYRRADGTILTADCPTGVRRKRVRVALAVGAVTALAAGAAAHAQRPAPMMGDVGPATHAVTVTPATPTPPTVAAPEPVTVIQSFEMGQMIAEPVAPARPADRRHRTR
jgi:hypothetical protein